jgi:hypothetical protein
MTIVPIGQAYLRTPVSADLAGILHVLSHSILSHPSSPCVCLAPSFLSATSDIFRRQTAGNDVHCLCLLVAIIERRQIGERMRGSVSLSWQCKRAPLHYIYLRRRTRIVHEHYFCRHSWHSNASLLRTEDIERVLLIMVISYSLYIE